MARWFYRYLFDIPDYLNSEQGLTIRRPISHQKMANSLIYQQILHNLHLN